MVEQANAQRRWLGIAIGIVLPSLVTWSYFVLLADSVPSLQQGTYSVGKVAQFLFPVFWVLFALRCSLRHAGIGSMTDESQEPRMTQLTSVAMGVAMGLLVTALMFAIYNWGFPPAVKQTLTEEIADRIDGFGVDSWPKYLGLSMFYAIVHSFLEEYYYRWFVFGQLRHVTRPWTAVVISGLAFMGHHVIVLAHYFGGLSPITIFLSLCIAVGGMIWAWQYEKSRSLLGPWLSHLLVDAGIFAVGYVALRGANAL